MGVVYRVRQIFLKKDFALKTMDNHSMSEVAIRRFQHEARTACAVDHPNIIAVHDFGLLDEQIPFLVMEIAEGETLGERLKRSGCLTVDEAAPIFVQVCFGLAYAHELGVVHRDIKPNNIMLLHNLTPGTEGSVKIVDFGIAKFAQHEGGEIQALTRTGEIFGSPIYMSPEQCGGQRVDLRADIYSLGCVLFESLAGTPPFIAENALGTMIKHQTAPAPTLKEASLGREFPQAMEQIVATMLAKSPAARYQNLGIAAHDLAAIQRGEAIPIRTVQLKPDDKEKTLSISRNNLYAVLAFMALISASVIGVIAYVYPETAYFFHNDRNKNSPLNQVNSKTEAIPEEHTPVFSLRDGKVMDSALDHVPSTDELAKKLARPDGVLKLRNCTLTDETFKQIAASSSICYVDLMWTHYSNESLARLAKLPHLTQILLTTTNFSDSGANALSKCKFLSKIEANWADLSDDGVCKLAALPALRRLDVAGSRMTDKSLVCLGKSKKLVNLNLRNTGGITNQGLESLVKTHLQVLNLEGTPIDDRGIAYLFKMRDLEKVMLNKTKVTVDGIKKLCANKKIRAIYLTDCPKIKEEDLKLLASTFPQVRFFNKGPLSDDHD